MSSIHMTTLHDEGPVARFSSRARRVALVFGAAWCAASAAHAQADCSAVIAAYAKADATKRFAIYSAESMAQAPKGKPFHVEIGDKSVTDTGYGKEYMSTGGGTSLGEGNSLASEVKANKKRCESLGDGEVGDEAVTGYSIRSAKSGQDPFAIHFWISKSTGLPMYHGMGPGAGLRWVYGPGVVMPAGAPK